MTNIIAQLLSERKSMMLVPAPTTLADEAALKQLAALLETTPATEVICLVALGREYEQVRARYSLQRSLDG